MSDREESPDWLREFQAPTQNVVTLSSASDSSPEVSPRGSRDSDHSDHEEPDTRKENQDAIQIDSGEDTPVIKAIKSKPLKIKKDHDVEEDAFDAHNEEPVEEDISEKTAGPSVSSRLPLMFREKVHRSKALVECDRDSIDLSGDVGSVGRIVISNGPAGNNEMLLDLKGTIYKSTIVPSRTFCIVSVGQSEAKIEAIMNDFIKLEPQSNVFEAETMIEGTLDGFSFDSDEEGQKMSKPAAPQSDQNNENGDKANTKSKRKVEKSSGMINKRVKAAGRPSKTVKKTKKSKK
ncbi:DNA-binding protein BIN4 [Asparagus officinalis]|nr:DNA-binding protein BIN4 [Asparagus officinalis]